MEALTLENILDLREAVSRRLNELATYKGPGLEGQQEAQRRAESLKKSMDAIEDRAKDLQFEQGQLPY